MPAEEAHSCNTLCLATTAKLLLCSSPAATHLAAAVRDLLSQAQHGIQYLIISLGAVLHASDALQSALHMPTASMPSMPHS